MRHEPAALWRESIAPVVAVFLLIATAGGEQIVSGATAENAAESPPPAASVLPVTFFKEGTKLQLGGRTAMLRKLDALPHVT